MSRAKEWEEELINRFPTIDRDGVPATAEFIAILEEMGGFDEGAYLDYYFLTHDITISAPTSNWRITPFFDNFDNNQISSFHCVFYPLSYRAITKTIQPTSTAIRDFLSINWLTLFPKEST